MTLSKRSQYEKESHRIRKTFLELRQAVARRLPPETVRKFLLIEAIHARERYELSRLPGAPGHLKGKLRW